ncbi:hypothetical protein MMC16_003432 [Acarospora aff. strigata]|nr:hypothetical protein [Acarospora aff. strigata]
MPYYRGPVGGQRAIDRRTFGYNMRGIYTIPQYYQHDSCTILIDLDEPTQLPPAPGDVQVESSWADLHRYVLELIHNCVTVERGRGGDNFVGGFEIWLRNELDMAPDELGPLQDCIDIADEARTGAGTLLEKRNERVRKCRTSGKEGALSRHGIPGHQTA